MRRSSGRLFSISAGWIKCPARRPAPWLFKGNRVINRRGFLAAVPGVLAAASVHAQEAEPAPDRTATGYKHSDMQYGPSHPFSFDALTEEARARAGKAYAPPYRPAPEITAKIDYDAHGKIRFKPEYALFADQPHTYPVTFFHLGQYFQKKVVMNVVADGQAREILYSPNYFDMPADSVARGLPSDSGFAGFRLQESRSRKDWKTQDWTAFLGASYFRAIGALNQYGLSARGAAVDVAAPTPEEFPDFTAFYIESAGTEADPVKIWAMLDSPSLSGAFSFAISRTDGVVMDIEARLFIRKPIYRLGLAPLTSMFWFAEYNRPQMMDWRPEVHDSDGLALWTGKGERIWRPLNNPDRVMVSSFQDVNPKGFGLLQRDRNPDDYLDGVNYDRRPSLWVEPLSGWGDGAIQLVEIPTDDEIHDNIVAFWVPKDPVQPGQSFTLKYRLHWLAEEPYPATQFAHVVATRIGRGGEPGKPRPRNVTKFVVDFDGGPLLSMNNESNLTANIWTSRGTISRSFVEPIPRTQRWRADFDLTADFSEPAELRLFLHQGDRALSETWTFQYLPPRR